MIAAIALSEVCDARVAALLPDLDAAVGGLVDQRQGVERNGACSVQPAQRVLAVDRACQRVEYGDDHAVHTMRRPVGLAHSKANILFHSLFMSTTVQPLATASSQALSSLPIFEARS